MKGPPKLIFEEGDYRIVVANERYVVEKKDGLDSMGVQKWKTDGECLEWPDNRGEDREHIVVERPMFRMLMKIVIAYGKRQDQ